MAIHFADTTSGIVFGDIGRIAGLTNLSVAFTVTTRAAGMGYGYILSQWGDAAPTTQRAFIVYWGTTDEVHFTVYYNGGYLGYRTNSSRFVPGAFLRVLWRAFDLDSAGRSMDCWINGTKEAGLIDGSVSPTLVTQVNNASSNVCLGYQVASPSYGMYGTYSEIAIWGEKVPDTFARDYGLGLAPAAHPRNGILYAPLGNIVPVNVWGVASVGVQTGGRQGPHPLTMEYGRGRHGLTGDAKLDEALKGYLIPGGGVLT